MPAAWRPLSPSTQSEVFKDTGVSAGIQEEEEEEEGVEGATRASVPLTGGKDTSSRGE